MTEHFSSSTAKCLASLGTLDIKPKLLHCCHW